MDAVDRRLAEVKAKASGLMPLGVYRRLHHSAAAARGACIVEIGTYCGAATVALALGAKAGAGQTVLSADLLQPGVGAAGASVEERIASLRTTFARFGVAEGVRFVHGTSQALVAAEDPREIGLLLLDGGGRIDADLALLWDRLAPGCTIVIDDVDGAVRVRRRGGSATVDQKHRLSKLLAEAFVEAGLLVPLGETGSTGWYAKGEAATDPGAIERLALPAYRELVKAEVPAREFGLPRALLRALARRAPALARGWRRLRPEPGRAPSR